MRFALTALAVPLLGMLAAAPAAAQDYPRLKPGLWEVTSRSSAQGPTDPPLKSTMCLDEVTSKEMYNASQGMMAGLCSKFDVKHDGNKYTSEAICKIGESKMIAKSTMTVVGDSSYTIQGTSTYDPPFMGMKDSQTTLDGKYVGPCKDGLVPGDFVGPNGQKFNFKGIASMKGAMPPAQPKSPAKAPQ